MNLKLCFYRALAGWHWAGSGGGHLCVCSPFSCVCVSWLTQPALSSLLKGLLHDDSLSDKHRSSVHLHLCPHPLEPRSCTHSPCPLTRTDFKTSRINRQGSVRHMQWDPVQAGEKHTATCLIITCHVLCYLES